MCGGGGGGDPMAYEKERQGKIQETIDKINAIFNNGREAAPQFSYGQPKTFSSTSNAKGIASLAGPIANQIQQQNGGIKYSDVSGAQKELERLDGIISAGTGGIRQFNKLEKYQGASAASEIEAAKRQRQALAQAVDQYQQKYQAWEDAAPDQTREQLYADHRQNVYDLNTRDLDKQMGDESRRLKFNLARAGQAGGSLDVDSSAELKRRYDEGLLHTSELADKAAEGLRTSDERTRMNLIAQAQTGLDSTSATSAALRQLDQNQQSAFAESQAATIGDVFAGLADAYGRTRYGQGSTGVYPPYGAPKDGGLNRTPAAPGRTYQGS